jgi:uracil-DNA glycosylase
MSVSSPAPAKLDTYRELVACRRACRACAGLHNPAEPDLAAYDSDEIGPWTRLLGDLNAPLMIVGQDWGGVRYYMDHRGLDDLRNPTMRTLERLLNDVGIPACLSRYEPQARGIFLTNAILCLKDGGLQGAVRDEWFRACGVRFLKPTIEQVAPRVVVALGARAHAAIMQAWSLKPIPLREAVALPGGTMLPCGSRLLAVYHCGNRVLNMTRGYGDQLLDWKRVATWLDRAPDTSVCLEKQIRLF